MSVAATDYDLETDEIASAVSSGACILFLGAGVHCAPPEGSRYVYPEEERPPMGSALSRHLAEACQLKKRYPDEGDANLARVALFYETTKSRNQLVAEIEAAVHQGKRPSPALRALAELPFPLVVTTNFDQLFERSLDAADKSSKQVTVYSPKSTEATRAYRGMMPTPKDPWVIKMHGDIGTPESMVITDEDYIQFVQRMFDKDPYHPVPMMARALFSQCPMLFVGYSLIDYNLRLLFKTLRGLVDQANIPDAYSVDLYPDPLILAVWGNKQQYVRFLAENVWEFVPSLYKKVKGEEMPDYRT
jgi:hypothetical protein